MRPDVIEEPLRVPGRPPLGVAEDGNRGKHELDRGSSNEPPSRHLAHTVQRMPVAAGGKRPGLHRAHALQDARFAGGR
jgi:hypothetical protein